MLSRKGARGFCKAPALSSAAFTRPDVTSSATHRDSAGVMIVASPVVTPAVVETGVCRLCGAMGKPYRSTWACGGALNEEETEETNKKEGLDKKD